MTGLFLDSSDSEFTYTVLYGPGMMTMDSNVRVETVTNYRPCIVLQKPQWEGTTAGLRNGIGFSLISLL